MVKQEVYEADKAVTLGCSLHYDPETRILEIKVVDEKAYKWIYLEDMLLEGGVAREVKYICDNYNVKMLSVKEGDTELFGHKIKSYTYDIASGDVLINVS